MKVDSWLGVNEIFNFHFEFVFICYMLVVNSDAIMCFGRQIIVTFLANHLIQRSSVCVFYCNCVPVN